VVHNLIRLVIIKNPGGALANHVLFKPWQLAMMPARTRLLLLGLAALAVWAALWALLGFDFWYVGATCLFFALLVAWRIDVTTREILRRRAEDEKNLPRRGDDSSQT
jgi:membrane protein implicated in regulation of membrane protease activity